MVSWWDVVGLLKAEREATQPQVPDEHVEGAPRGESAGLHPRRDLLVAGCQTGDNLGPREEAPLSACQGQACVPHEPQ